MSLSSLLFAVVAAGIGFGGGWTMRRAASSGETQALRRSMYESKGAIPQLEASLRTRDQRISVYQSESEQMRSRITQLESQISQKDNEIVRRDRDIRRLASELEIAKESGGGETPAGDEPLPFDGVITPREPADPSLEARLKKAEARYEALKRGIIQRDEKIGALEHALKQMKDRTSMTALESELEELTNSAQTLASTLAGRDTLVKDLEARLQREAEQREVLESLAKRRGDANRELKEKLAKLEGQLPKLLETMKARQGIIAERDATIRALDTELEHVKRERADRDATIAAAEQKLSAQREELTGRDVKIEELEHRVHERDKRIDALTHELAGTNRMLQRAEATVRERDASLAADAEKMASLDAREREHERAMAALEGSVRDRDFRIDTLNAELAKVTAALEAARRESGSALASQNAASDKLTLETNRLNAEAKALRDRIDMLTRQSDALQKDLQARDRRLVELERERAQLTERVTALESPNDSKLHLLETQLNAARERCLRIEDELLAANKEAKQLRHRVAELEAGDATSGAAPIDREHVGPMLANGPQPTSGPSPV
jgi:chromosome segregation ATPase